MTEFHAIWAVTALAAATMFAVGIALPLVTSAAPRLLGRASSGRVVTPWGSTPAIDFLIPAYLEASVVGEKIRKTRAALDEYRGGGRVIVLSSDPATAAAAHEADLVIDVGRGGKPDAVNRGVAFAEAPVVVVSDANCDVSAGWPEATVRGLERADLVSANKTEEGGAEGAFWAYERIVKGRQGAGGESLSVVGEFVAFRRTDFRPMPVTELIDDLWTALDFALRGLSVRVLPEITTSEPAARQRDQWERRVRIAEGMLGQQLARIPAFMRVEAGRRFVAHKFYRLTIGCLAFWAMLVAAASIFPVVTAPIVLLVAPVSVARYSGRVFESRPVGPIASVIGMQAVPVVAAGRIAKNAFRRSGNVGWTKVAR